ncbi:hypothetical protein [Pontibacter pamirensis]|uniref:hypothetical protein n=1 Tax=Pontibacter pamirensis TaxID=2562824 RepID=UPI0013897250|nr:hypothetical protein [Pontibacter pamirensis]
MEYVDLNTGFALMGFPDYREFKRAKQLCIDKFKFIAYAGEFSHLREIQAKHWVRTVHNGYQNYTIPLQKYDNHTPGVVTPDGVGSGLRSMATAVQELERKTHYEVKFVIVVRK